MKTNNDNIISSFFKRALFAIVFISILSSISIYYFQQYNFYTSMADEIKLHVDKKLSKYDKNLKLSDVEILEEDVKSFMKNLGFIITEIYDNEQNIFFTFKRPGERFKSILQLIDKNHDFLIHDFPTSKGMSYKFFNIEKNNHFLQIFYPIYKSNKLLGYVEGISYVEPMVVKRLKRGIFAIIVTVVSTILIFSFLIFPLIYVSYKKLKKHSLELLSSNITTITTLGNAIALRDSDTNEHNYRVTLYSIKFAQTIGLDDESIKTLIKGAFLHDVGKIGISDNILLKNTHLNEEEFEIMRSHVIKGVKLVSKNSWLEDAKDVILYHHEKYDGSGYLKGLKGEQIPINARIFAIADVFDALTSKRPYKEPFSYEKTKSMMQELSGKHFDPILLDTFFNIVPELYNDIKDKYSDDEIKKLLEQKIYNYVQ